MSHLFNSNQHNSNANEWYNKREKEKNSVPTKHSSLHQQHGIWKQLFNNAKKCI